jgi:hypothetical protein
MRVSFEADSFASCPSASFIWSSAAVRRTRRWKSWSAASELHVRPTGLFAPVPAQAAGAPFPGPSTTITYSRGLKVVETGRWGHRQVGSQPGLRTPPICTGYPDQAIRVQKIFRVCRFRFLAPPAPARLRSIADSEACCRSVCDVLIPQQRPPRPQPASLPSPPPRPRWRRRPRSCRRAASRCRRGGATFAAAGVSPPEAALAAGRGWRSCVAATRSLGVVAAPLRTMAARPESTFPAGGGCFRGLRTRSGELLRSARRTGRAQFVGRRTRTSAARPTTMNLRSHSLDKLRQIITTGALVDL